MNRTLPLLALAAAAIAIAHPARAQLARAEHTLYVKIETIPPGATLTTIPANENANPIILGKTPVTLPIGCDWDTSYLRKKFNLLRLTSPANIATNTYDPDDNTHTLTLNLAIEKDGHQRQLIQQTAAILTHNKAAENWDQAIRSLPERRTLTYTLTPQPTGTTETPTTEPAGKKTIPTVIVARGQPTDADKLGYATIETPAGAPILANGLHAGTAPLRLILPAGTHTIGTTQKDGKPAPTQTITIEPGKTTPVTL